jgi:hypothetical protein
MIPLSSIPDHDNSYQDKYQETKRRTAGNAKRKMAGKSVAARQPERRRAQSLTNIMP